MKNFIWTLEDYFLYSLLIQRMAIASSESTPEIFEKRIAYGEHSNQYLILMLPKNPVREERLAVFIHGGEWRRGSPAEYRFVGKFFAKRGYPALLLGYRLVPRFRFPAQVVDVFSALKAGLETARMVRVRTDKIILTGHSAGGHLASLITYDKQRLLEYGINQQDIKGLMTASAPLDFSACRNARVRRLIADFMDGSKWDKANPISFVQGDEDIPVLAIHGDMDPLVEKENSINFANKVNAAHKGLAELIIARGTFHMDTIETFLGNNRFSDSFIEWMRKTA